MSITATGKIQIIRIPAGQLPFEIRQRWVGCVLPCLPVLGKADEEQGILDGKAVEQRELRMGVKVPEQIALQILHDRAPDVTNQLYALGFGRKKNAYLFFGEDEIRILSGVRRQTIIRADDMEMGFFEFPGR